MKTAYWVEHVTPDNVYCLILIAEHSAIATVQGENTPEGQFQAVGRTVAIEDTLEDTYEFIDTPHAV